MPFLLSLRGPLRGSEAILTPHSPGVQRGPRMSESYKITGLWRRLQTGVHGDGLWAMFLPVCQCLTVTEKVVYGDYSWCSNDSKKSYYLSVSCSGSLSHYPAHTLKYVMTLLRCLRSKNSKIMWDARWFKNAQNESTMLSAWSKCRE